MKTLNNRKIQIQFFIKGSIMQRIDIRILKMRIFGLGQGTSSRSYFCHQPSIFGRKNITMNYLFLKCNSTLLTASSARDIHSTITMLVSSVYFQSPNSKGGQYLTYMSIVLKPLTFIRKLLIQYKLRLSCAYYQALEWLQALTRYTR